MVQLEPGQVPEPFTQDRDESGVELDGDDATDPPGQRPRQRTEAGPDLQDGVAGVQGGRIEDPVDGVGVDQEVLAVGAPQRQVVGVEQPTGLGGREVPRTATQRRPSSSAQCGQAPQPRAACSRWPTAICWAGLAWWA